MYKKQNKIKNRKQNSEEKTEKKWPKHKRLKNEEPQSNPSCYLCSKYAFATYIIVLI